jgi:hypothetical protein
MLKKGRARFLDKFKSKSGASKPLEVHNEKHPDRTMYPPPFSALFSTILRVPLIVINNKIVSTPLSFIL